MAVAYCALHKFVGLICKDHAGTAQAHQMDAKFLHAPNIAAIPLSAWTFISVF